MCRSAQKSNVSTPTPWSMFGVEYPNICFARNCMKCEYLTHIIHNAIFSTLPASTIRP